MAYVHITAPDTRLDSLPELIEGWLDDLVASRGWVSEYEVNVGINGYERWVSKVGANTVNGDELVFGCLVDEGGSTGNTGSFGESWDLLMLGSKIPFSQAQNPLTVTDISDHAGVGSSDREYTFSGNHNLVVGDVVTFDNSVVDDNGGTQDLAGAINGVRKEVSAVPSATVAVFGELTTSLFDQYVSGGACVHAWGDYKGVANQADPFGTQNRDNGPSGVNFVGNLTNFVQAWFLTPSDTTGVTTDHQYAYCVVEVSPGIYRAFGFGEMIKIGDWDGGAFILGDWVDPTGDELSHDHASFGNGVQDVTQQDGLLRNHVVLYRENLNGIVHTSENSIHSNGWTNTYDNETQAGSFANGGGDGGIVPSTGGVGSGQLNRSPSAFSGEAYRSPIRFYAYVATNTATGHNPNDARPMGEYPDIFRTNVRDMDPGTLVLDDTENFLVKPDYRKSTASNPTTGNHGVLIKQRV